MAARATWRGSLKLSLISVPIRVFPATNAASDVSFHQIHRKCKTRIQLRKWCPHCEEIVEAADIVKGQETDTGRYAIVEDEEIAALKPKSTKTVDVSHVVDATTVDPVYIERAYYVTPDTAAAGEPFAVIREALEGRAAVGRLALHGREYLVAILPRDLALMLYTLRTKGEVRALAEVEERQFAAVKPKAPEVKLARQVLSTFETEADLSSFTDHYQEALREMLKRKQTEEVGEVTETDGRKKTTKVVNLMDALRQSLAQVEGTRRAQPRTGHTAVTKRPRILKHPATRSRKKAS
jgi:DNA end-binding protein Ku